jgi:acyl-coenzyme A thioesterase PaaI-like protein
MHVTELAINQTLGMQLAPAGSDHILEMPESPLHLNHVGTVHASVQFALAEASSGEFLLRHLGEAQNQVFAVLRTSNVKFRKPAYGALRASARFVDGVGDLSSAELASRGRASASVLVEVADAQGVVTMTGQYDWFFSGKRKSNGSPGPPGA